MTKKFDREEWLSRFEDMYADGGEEGDYLKLITPLFELIESYQQGSEISVHPLLPIDLYPERSK